MENAVFQPLHGCFAEAVGKEQGFFLMIKTDIFHGIDGRGIETTGEPDCFLQTVLCGGQISRIRAKLCLQMQQKYICFIQIADFAGNF